MTSYFEGEIGVGNHQGRGLVKHRKGLGQNHIGARLEEDLVDAVERRFDIVALSQRQVVNELYIAAGRVAPSSTTSSSVICSSLYTEAAASRRVCAVSSLGTIPLSTTPPWLAATSASAPATTGAGTSVVVGASLVVGGLRGSCLLSRLVFVLRFFFFVVISRHCGCGPGRRSGWCQLEETT
jgi:hypothetical protein